MNRYNCINVKTDRLEIRPLESRDYQMWLDGFKEQKVSQNRFDEGSFDTSVITYEWFLNKLREREALGNKDICYMFNVFRREDGKSIGYCDITTHLRDCFQYARVGYTIHNQFWNKGYGKETIKALVIVAFDILNFHRLEAHINLDNEISKKIVLSAGFKFEGIRKRFILEDGVWTDNEIYFITNEAWKEELDEL